MNIFEDETYLPIIDYDHFQRRLEDLPNPEIEPWSPAFQADSLSSEPPGKPICNVLNEYLTVFEEAGNC